MNLVKLLGGLGNQMFQYAFGQALKGKTIYDISWYLHLPEGATPRNLELQHFNCKLNLRENSLINQAEFWVCNKLNKLKKYDGYFQNEQYFKSIRKQLLRDFSLKEKLNISNEQILQKIKETESVSVHIRRGDYVRLRHIHPECSLEYYEKAIRYILDIHPNAHFFLFSDDIPWVKKEFKMPKNYDIVDVNDADFGYRDLELMKNCKHNIIANSSFSWWRAWLNENINKVVIAPQIWQLISEEDNKNICPSEWIRL